MLHKLLPGSHAFTTFQASRWLTQTTEASIFKHVGRIPSKCGNAASQAKNDATCSSTQALPRLRVILNLDRTMVYLNEFEEIYWNSGCETREIKFNWNNRDFKYWMLIRPRLDDALDLLSLVGDLYIYSGAPRPCVEAVTKSIDPTGSLFKKIFTRSDLFTIYGNGDVANDGDLKDIRIIEKDFLASRTLLIDSRLKYLEPQPKNGLYVSPFYGNEPRHYVDFLGHDEDLFKVALQIAAILDPAPDIRPLIQNYHVTIPDCFRI